jgi:uncharacterized protein YbdZ (MbtH family)|tara:strand:- start:167 stop:286 length:120 start_codon:yes stop_codon:yes gene_type:complete
MLGRVNIKACIRYFPRLWLKLRPMTFTETNDLQSEVGLG